MEIHPIAELLPELDEDQLGALADDIEVNGQLEPVVLWDGKVIDGRNRVRACERVGVEIKTRDMEFADDGEAARFVLSKNVRRRHLDSGQRAMVAAELSKLFEAEAHERRVKGGQKKGETQEDTGKAAEKAAKITGAKTRTVEMAKSVKAKAIPEIVALVKAGDISLNSANTVASMSAEAQQEVAAGGADAVKAAAKEIRDKRKRAKATMAQAEKKTGVGTVVFECECGAEIGPGDDHCAKCGQTRGSAAGSESKIQVERRRSEPEPDPEPGAEPSATLDSDPTCSGPNCGATVDRNQCIEADDMVFCSLLCLVSYKVAHGDWNPSEVDVSNAAGDLDGFLGALDLPAKRLVQVRKVLKGLEG